MYELDILIRRLSYILRDLVLYRSVSGTLGNITELYRYNWKTCSASRSIPQNGFWLIFHGLTPRHRIRKHTEGSLKSEYLKFLTPRLSVRMLSAKTLVRQLLFVANKNAEPADPPLFWPVNCITLHKILGDTLYS